MRMMFTSPRLENVETVQALFEAAGIETKITGTKPFPVAVLPITHASLETVNRTRNCGSSVPMTTGVRAKSCLPRAYWIRRWIPMCRTVTANPHRRQNRPTSW